MRQLSNDDANRQQSIQRRRLKSKRDRRSAAEARTESLNGRSTVLLAEDDRDMRRMVARSLRSSGYDVVEVKDGKELLDRIASGVLGEGRTKPDLIISDIRMPGWTGLEVVGGLRNSDWAMPVILITAFGDSETHEEARRLGAAIVLNKPFDLEELNHAVHSIIPPAF